MRMMPRVVDDQRGVAATVVLFPLFAVVAFMFIQALLWQHDRELAAAAADRASAAVALYGSNPDAARSDAVAELSAAGVRHVKVTVVRSADTTVVDISGEAPGILVGTSATVHAHSVTPTQGYRTP